MAKSFPNTGATVGLAADRTALTSPFAGMQFFETDTKALYLYDGSAWVSMLDTDTPPGLVYISSFATGSVTSYPINNVFSSAFTNYKLILRSVSAPSSDTDIGLRLRTSGTDATTSYQTMGTSMRDSGVTASYNASAATYWYLGQSDGPTVGPYYASSIDIYSPFVTAQTFATGLASSIDSLGFSAGYYLTYNRTVSASHDGFTLLGTSGATINLTGIIYGYKG